MVSLIGASDFRVIVQPAPLIAPLVTSTFQVRFAPPLTGTQTATVTLANTDSDENPYNFVIQGTGTPIRLYLPLVLK